MTQITDALPTNIVMRLPYRPDFIYAAYKGEDGSENSTWTIYRSMPKFLEHHIHVLDVSGTFTAADSAGDKQKSEVGSLPKT